VFKKRKFTPFPEIVTQRQARIKTAIVNLIDQDLEAAIHIQAAEEIIRKGS